MRAERMMKWRVRRQSRCSSDDNEDIRRSLEVLDSVLAEFDDHDIFSGVAEDGCGDDDDVKEDVKRRGSEHNVDRSDKCDSAKNRISNNSSDPPSTAKHTNGHCQELEGSSSLKSAPTDGAPSQAAVELSEECRKYSPPPVPRRSPTTRLSNRDNPFFSKESPPKEPRRPSKGPAELTGSKGATLSSSERIDTSPENVAESPSSYLSGHDEIMNEDAGAFADCDEDVADDVFVPAALQGSGGHVSPAVSAVCRACGRDFVKSPSPCDMRSKMEARLTSAMAEALRRRLDKKFEKTRELLRRNQIAGLDAKPPSFKPPPAPKKVSKSGATGCNGDVILTGVQTPPRSDCTGPMSARVNNITRNLCSSNTSLHSESFAVRSEAAVKQHHHSYSELNPLATSSASEAVQNSHSENVCNSCSKKRPPIGALSKLGSPNTLQRPPLGLSYSMEDDLSPGIKEIRSSTPKPDYDQDEVGLSSPKESPVVFMSTFSRSVSSLGDSSSQSDSDFSFSQESSGKVPLTSIRSMTLPTDMKLGPSMFYSSIETEEDGGEPKSLDIKSLSPGLGLEEVRSSSAPPPPPNKGHWKDPKKLDRSNRGSKNAGSADWSRPETDEDTAVGKPKKRGIWKSILRRK